MVKVVRSRAFWTTLGGLAVLGPLVLSIWVELPYLVYAMPPMVLGLWTWIFMRGLDRPRPVARVPPEGTVVALRRRRVAEVKGLPPGDGAPHEEGRRWVARGRVR